MTNTILLISILVHATFTFAQNDISSVKCRKANRYIYKTVKENTQRKQLEIEALDTTEVAYSIYNGIVKSCIYLLLDNNNTKDRILLLYPKIPVFFFPKIYYNEYETDSLIAESVFKRNLKELNDSQKTIFTKNIDYYRFEWGPYSISNIESEKLHCNQRKEILVDMFDRLRNSIIISDTIFQKRIYSLLCGDVGKNYVELNGLECFSKFIIDPVSKSKHILSNQMILDISVAENLSYARVNIRLKNTVMFLLT